MAYCYGGYYTRPLVSSYCAPVWFLLLRLSAHRQKLLTTNVFRFAHLTTAIQSNRSHVQNHNLNLSLSLNQNLSLSLSHSQNRNQNQNHNQNLSLSQNQNLSLNQNLSQSQNQNQNLSLSQNQNLSLSQSQTAKTVLTTITKTTHTVTKTKTQVMSSELKTAKTATLSAVLMLKIPFMVLLAKTSSTVATAQT